MFQFDNQSTNPADAVSTAVLDAVSVIYDNWYNLLIIVLICVIAFGLLFVLKIAVNKFGRDYGLDPKAIRTIHMLLTYFIIILAVVNILPIFGAKLYPLLLSLGIISVVVIFGSQLVISNVIGGAIVYIEKPFVLDDVIKVGDNIGVVDEIHYRSTILTSLNGLSITIPNSTFLTASVVNYTRTKSYLLKIPFSMPRTVDLSGLKESLRAESASISGFKSERDINLYKLNMSKDKVDYELHLWISDPRDSEKVMTRVLDIVDNYYPSGKDHPAA